MLSTFETLVEQYLKDIIPLPTETVAQTQARAARIKEEYPRVYREMINNFQVITADITELQNNPTLGGDFHMDGGAPDSVYLPFQKHDGGSID